MTSPATELQTKKRVSYHLGQIARDFRSRKTDEAFVESLDETHFIVYVDNGKTIGFCGDENVKY